MTRNSDARVRDGSVMAVMKVASYPRRPSHLSDLWSKSNPIMKAWAHAAAEIVLTSCRLPTLALNVDREC